MNSLSRGTVFLPPEARARHIEPLVELAHVRKDYPDDVDKTRVAIADLSLAVARGELVSIIGPPGSGRSTLLHLMSGLERPTAGRVAFDGEDFAKLSVDRLESLRSRSIGMVHHFPFLLNAFSVLENAAIPIRLTGISRRAASERGRELLERHGLTAVAESVPGSLSLEQQVRVAVVRALANDPVLLLADEPERSLDADGAARLHEFFAALHRNGLTIVYATRDPELALRAPRRLHLEGGRLAREEEVRK